VAGHGQAGGSTGQAHEGEHQPPVRHAAISAVRFDALLPNEMAHRGVEIGTKKAAMDAGVMFVLAVLAGAFIALGGIFATTAGSGSIPVTGTDGAQVATLALPYGVTRVLVGAAFSLGLILVVVAGAELFTGNVLIVMAWASRRVSSVRMFRNWGIVYAGNLVGAIGTAGLVVASGWYLGGGGAVGTTLLATARTKVAYPFGEAFLLGILCNILVCLAVWLTYSARSTTDRILAIVPPIAAFVACGFEHSVANMFYIPAAIMLRTVAPPEFWASAHLDPATFASVDVAGFIGNAIPVALGNVVGGAVFVAAVYWLAYLRPSLERRAERASATGARPAP
jgi:formate transporter